MDSLQQSTNIIESNTKRGLGDFIFGIFTLVVVLINSGYALTTSMYTLGTYVGAVYIAIMLIRKRYLERGRKLIFLCGVLVFMIISLVANLDIDGINEAVRVFVIVACGYTVAEVYTFPELTKAFCYLMRFSSIISILFYYAISTGVLTNSPVLTDGRDVEYYTCIIANIQKTDPLRNSGLFWEGGMLAAFCALWMLCEILFIEQAKWKRNIFLILGGLTISTTLSTSGYLYIILIILLIIAYGAFRERKIWQQIIFIVGVIAVISIFYHFEDVINYLVQFNSASFEKIINRNTSFTDRTNGPIVDLYIGLQHPFGVGFSHLNEIVKETSEKLFQKSLTARTSTLTYFFPAMGLVGGSIVNFQWLRFFSKANSSKIVCVVAGIIFAVLCTSTPLYSNCIFWIILFEGAESMNMMSSVQIIDQEGLL